MNCFRGVKIDGKNAQKITLGIGIWPLPSWFVGPTAWEVQSQSQWGFYSSLLGWCWYEIWRPGGFFALDPSACSNLAGSPRGQKFPCSWDRRCLSPFRCTAICPAIKWTNFMLSLLCTRIREIHRNSRNIWFSLVQSVKKIMFSYIRHMTKVYRHGGVMLFYGCVCNAGI